ncbi:MAG: tyrosine-type recombinase/integrase [Cellulosilyticaceae bacterium]
MTTTQAIKLFLTNVAYDGHSVHTIKAYRQDLNQWEGCIGEKELDTLCFEDFEKYLSFLHGEGLKTTSLRRKRVVVHRFLKYCYEKRFCEERLYEWIDPIKLKKQKKPKEVLTSSELGELWRYIADEIETYEERIGESNHYDYLYYSWIRNALLTSVLLYTGCRATEAVALKKTDRQEEQNVLVILAKGNKYNSIPIHDQLHEAFKLYDSRLQKLTNEEIRRHLEKSPYLFPARMDGKHHLATRTLHDLMLKYSEVLDRHIHAHIFRHTFASYCIAANMDISTISSLISHSNPAITLSIYTHEIESNQKHREMKKLRFDDFGV